jgi:hypothetical protein
MVAQLTHSTIHKPLGTILKEAGLISDYQIQVALQDQQFDSSLLFGEILALRGWIQKETADFFVEEFPKITKQKHRQKIGYYLKKAKLLNQEQVDSIIQEQKNNLIRFGSAAVLKGYLKQKTLDFLSENLFKGHADASYLMTFDPKEISQKAREERKIKEVERLKEARRLEEIERIRKKKTSMFHQETYLQHSQLTYIQSENENLDCVENEENLKWID